MRASLSLACLVFLILLITAAQAVAARSSPTAAQVVIGSGTAASCQSAAAVDAFSLAVSAGGVINFNCGPDPVVIAVQTNFTDQEVTVNGGSKITLSGENLRQIFVVTELGHLTLNDLTLQDGYAQMGGAIEIGHNGWAIIHRSVLQNNSAPGGGGAIYNVGGLLIEDSTISGNSSLGDGGGIYNTTCPWDQCLNPGTATINNSTISDNTASWGGGISSFAGSLAISGSTLANNSASSGGGGIYNCFSTLQLSGSTLTGNSGDQGGGIANCGKADIIESTLAGNSASYGGAINNGESGGLLLLNSTLSGNAAVEEGGGLYIDGGSTTMGNSTLSANSASNGGGIFNNLGDYGYLTLNNSLVANSSGGDCVNKRRFSASHSLIEDSGSACGLSSGAGGNIVGQDPHLGPLQANGGPTKTHALLAGSVAIDAGDNGLAAGLENDQRGAGFPRILGTAVDMGAFEFGGSVPPPPPAWPVYLPFASRP